MTQQTKNSHYIARHLTKPWEFAHPKRGPRHLWVYDFADDEFRIESSLGLYTADEAWPGYVEGFLNHYLETPLSRFLNRFNRNRDTAASQAELRAMKLAVMLQAERSGLQGDVEATAKRDELYLNSMVSAADEVFRFVHIPLRHERLFFPSSGLIMLPLLGAIAPAVALHPSYMCVAVPLPCEPFLQQLVRLRSNENWFTALSAGFASSERIVIPGSAWNKQTDNVMRNAILEARTIAARAVEGVSRINTKLFGSPSPTPRQWVEAQKQELGATIAQWAAKDADRSLYEITDDHIPIVPD